MPVSTRIIALLAALSLSSGVSLAQDEEEERCSVCDFEPIVIDGSETHYDEFRARVAAAEVPLREYTQDSLASIEMGSAHAVRDFSHWYRYKVDQENKREIANRAIAGIVGTGLELGLNFFLPGSGAVASAIRTYGSQAYGALVNQMPDGTTDPGPYLERISEDLENSNDRLNAFMIDMFQGTGSQTLRDQMNMIKMEYVWEKAWQRDENHTGALTRSPGEDTRRLLREIGIGPGGTATVAAVRERVLTKLINKAICLQARGNLVEDCEDSPFLYDRIAHGQALRLIFAGDPASMYSITDPEQLRRICAIEPSHWFYQNEDCRR